MNYSPRYCVEETKCYPKAFHLYWFQGYVRHESNANEFWFETREAAEKDASRRNKANGHC